MTSHNRKIKRGFGFDALLMRCLKNWAYRKTPPADARNRLLTAAAQYQEQRDVMDRHLLYRFLPGWLGTYLSYNSWVFGASDLRDHMHAPVYAESSYSIMVYLCRVRIAAA